MQCATVYCRYGILFTESSSKTTAGVWIGTSPLCKIEPGSTQSIIGEAAVKALNASQEGVPHPTNWNGLLTPLLELAGVKSWATFMRNAKCLTLEAEGGRLKIIPQRNLGPKEGYESLPERIVELALGSSPGEIGAALEVALASCQ